MDTEDNLDALCNLLDNDDDSFDEATDKAFSTVDQISDISKIFRFVTISPPFELILVICIYLQL